MVNHRSTINDTPVSQIVQALVSDAFRALSRISGHEYVLWTTPEGFLVDGKSSNVATVLVAPAPSKKRVKKWQFYSPFRVSHLSWQSQVGLGIPHPRDVSLHGRSS